jgi:hypothetical protein
MKLKHTSLLLENKSNILENLKQAKQYLQTGKLSEDDLKTLIQIDPTPTRKFVGWMAKIWITEKPNIDDLRNTIEEYNVFLEKGKAKTKDINQFKSFKELYSEIDQLNKTGEGISDKDLESDYDTIIDNSDLLIITPHTHEASRKLGLSQFTFRNCKNKGKDSAWCITHKAPDRFNEYYYKGNITFYYIKVKSRQMMDQLKKSFGDRWERMVVVALSVLDNNTMEGHDGLNYPIKKSDIKKYTNIIGIS